MASKIESLKNNIKKNKKRTIWVSIVCFILIFALVLGSVLVIGKLQIKTFQSADEMKSYVEGVYAEEINERLNYKITIKGDYITQERYGTVTDQENEHEYDIGGVEHRYHISVYDYEKGKIFTDEDTFYDLETEKNYRNNSQHVFTVKANNVITDNNHKYKKVD